VTAVPLMTEVYNRPIAIKVETSAMPRLLSKQETTPDFVEILQKRKKKLDV
jgi:hypothetical protein